MKCSASSATQEQIKQAYRQLALKWHPDRNSAPDATDRFKEVAGPMPRFPIEPNEPSTTPRATMRISRGDFLSGDKGDGASPGE